MRSPGRISHCSSVAGTRLKERGLQLQPLKVEDNEKQRAHRLKTPEKGKQTLKRLTKQAGALRQTFLHSRSSSLQQDGGTVPQP